MLAAARGGFTFPAIGPLAWPLAWLAAYWHLAVHASPSGLMAVAAAALATAAVAGLLAGFVAGGARMTAAVPVVARAAALRAKSRGTAFLRQRDPDAAGRIRPRAPSAHPAAG
jgi:Family of unknown function (DUF6412)